MSNVPLVSVNVPLTVLPALRVTPLALLMVRLLSTVELEGNSTLVVIEAAGEGVVYSTFTELPNVGAASSDPPLREMVAPFPIVRLLPPVNAPLVSVSVPFTVVAPVKDGEVDPASIVRFCKPTALLILMLPVVEPPLPIINVEFDVMLAEEFVIVRSPPAPALACLICTVPPLIVKLFPSGT